MNKIFLSMLVAVSSGSVLAADFVDTARVVSSTPISERVSEPRQECWTETVSSTGVVTKSAPVVEHSIGGALLGGVIGGVVGSQIGQGNGNTVATGAGAIAGAIIGDRVASQNAQQQSQTQTTQVPQTREERRCRPVENYRDVVRGYTVTYRYKGEEITTRLPYDPGAGSTVRVGISILPDSSAGADSDRRDARDYRDRDSRDKDYRREDRRWND